MYLLSSDRYPKLVRHFGGALWCEIYVKSANRVSFHICHKDIIHTY